MKEKMYKELETAENVEESEGKPKVSHVVIDAPMSCRVFSAQLGVSPQDLLNKLPRELFTQDDVLSMETLSQTARKFKNLNVKIKDEPIELPSHIMEELNNESGKPSVQRNHFIVSIVGEDGSGKTTLVDKLTCTNTAGVAGHVVNQHEIKLDDLCKNAGVQPTKSSASITLLDVPGDQFFLSLMSSCVKASDAVIIVQNAHSQEMSPLTIEAASLCKTFDKPAMLAINVHEDNDSVPNHHEETSKLHAARCNFLDKKKIQPIAKQLSEIIPLQSKVTIKSAFKGTVIDSQLEKGIGISASVIVQRGTLQVGQVLISGINQAKIKTIRDIHNKPTKQALPGEFVLVTGFDGTPCSGDDIFQVTKPSWVKQIIEYRTAMKDLEIKNQLAHELEADRIKYRDLLHKQLQPSSPQTQLPPSSSSSSSPSSLDIKDYIQQKQKQDKIKEKVAQLMMMDKGTGPSKVNVVVKADTQGLVDAMEQLAAMYSNHQRVNLNILKISVGSLSDGDVETARVEGARLIGLCNKCSSQVEKAARQHDVKLYVFKDMSACFEAIKLIMSEEASETLQEQAGTAVIKRRQEEDDAFDAMFVRTGWLGKHMRVNIMRDQVLVQESSIVDLMVDGNMVDKVDAGQHARIKLSHPVQKSDVLIGFQ
ncbi:hypothetical protein AKO1_014228 [Acrasis kona]|uniref:Translation initiation factor 2 n=1 Tax=Acrasis kona TaxID=1008807 RepID=A0AAW2Z001_9EUKA